APLVPMDALHTCVERPVRDDGVIAAWRGDVLVWFRFDPPAGQSHKSYCNDNFWGFLETEGFACIFATEVTALLFLEENGIETLATPLQE
ncbi:hypothetical protein KJ865_12185, partial [Myxococcota bacterium]|nr:hypothetical protein [Myxococcota bacterium]